jgi:hypothetical protein
MIFSRGFPIFFPRSRSILLIFSHSSKRTISFPTKESKKRASNYPQDKFA